MQDNNINDFDLELRSALEGAQIKPGRRVWRGVASSLDALSSAPAPVRRHPLLWVPALSLAVACLAAALVLFGTSDRSEPVRLIEHKAYTLADMASGEPSALLAQAREFPAARPLASAQRPAPAPSEEVEVYDIDASDSPAPECTQEQASESERAKAVKAPAPERSAIPDRDNPFVLDEYTSDIIKRRARPTVYAKGSLTGNDSDITRHSPLNNLAPGSESAGISELGASSYGVPFSLGVGVRFPITRRLSIGTGLDYTLLTRSFTGKYTPPGEFTLGGSSQEAGDVTHSLHYLGVPVDLFFDFLTSERLKLYVRAGGEAEYCLLNRYTLHSSPDIVTSYPVKKLQYSIGAGFGVEFALGEHLGLYIDPGFRYYFYCNQPKSVRTERPMLVNFDAGLRFSF